MTSSPVPGDGAQVGTFTADSVCDQCGHLMDPHLMVSTNGDPMDGGIMLCPHPGGCECYATWGVNGADPARLPDAQELADIRRQLFARP